MKYAVLIFEPVVHSKKESINECSISPMSAERSHDVNLDKLTLP